MDSTYWEIVGRLFEGALEQDPLDRDKWLEAACSGDISVRRRVAGLLAAHEEAPDFLEDPRSDNLAARVGSTHDISPGSTLGPYEVLRVLGEGGMGVVYEAAQQEPIRRTVALKVIRWGMGTTDAVARFDTEKQALALMDHPAIARVYDAGVTSGGRPYFAMEYVPGEPITAHCDHHRLTIAERLRLFVRVCQGVQHAHQKAVIHRDLKPSNVLVSLHDGEQRPKIIDFGVAKTTSRKLADQTLQTQHGVLIGTPAYMSPEQTEASSQDMDTRADVYGLGAMLYELLVGVPPFDSKELCRTGIESMVRRIREEDPPNPSSRLIALGVDARGTADRRGVDVATLAREITGDLDWITMRALEKDRARRYESPQDLAADIHRHMTDRPVLACPPSTAYRMRKFVRRHAWGVAVAVTGMMILIASIAATAFHFKRIAAERDLARQVQKELESVVAFQAEMLTATDPEKMGRGLMKNLRTQVAASRRNDGAPEEEIALTVASHEHLVDGVNWTDLAVDLLDQEILSAATLALEDRFAESPQIDTRLRGTIAHTYRGLGRYARAEALLERALAESRRVFGIDHPETLRSTGDLALVYWHQGRYAEAEPLYLEAIDAQKRALGEGHPDTLRSLNRLAILYRAQRRFSAAEAIYLETLEARRRTLGNEAQETLGSVNNLALLYVDQGRYAEAEPLYVETLTIRRRRFGDEDQETQRSINNLALLYKRQRRYPEAEALFLETLDLRKRMLGEDHPDTGIPIHNLGSLYLEQGRYEEADRYFERAQRLWDATLAPDHPHVAENLSQWAALYRRIGSEVAAGRLEARASAIREGSGP